MTDLERRFARANKQLSKAEIDFVETVNAIITLRPGGEMAKDSAKKELNVVVNKLIGRIKQSQRVVNEIIDEE